MPAADDAARKAAEAELQTLGDRSVSPLLEELRKIVDSPKSDAEAEKVILAALRLVAPKLTGYDPASTKAERLKRIEAWAQELPGSAN